MYAETMTVAAGPAALRAGKWVTCAGDGRTSFVDRRQAAECAAVALTTDGHDNKVYNITGTQTQTFADVAGILTEITGKPIEILNVSDEEFLAHLDKMGIPRQPLQQFNVDGFEWCGDDMLSFEVAMREGWWNVRSNDIQLLTGKPARTLREFCLEHAEGLRAAAR